MAGGLVKTVSIPRGCSYEIRLSKSPRTPGTLSSTLADNRGADEVIVHTGPLTIAAGDYPTGSSPNAFGATIAFTTSYTYTGGPLLPDYSHTPFPLTPSFADAVENSPDGQSAFRTRFGATTADIGMTNDLLIVQFKVVPEPASCGLLALGVSAEVTSRQALQQ